VEHQHGDEAVATGVRDRSTVSRKYLTRADYLEHRTAVDVERKISCVDERTRRIASPPDNHEESQDDIDGHHGLREHGAPDRDLSDQPGAPHHHFSLLQRLRCAPILIEKVDQPLQGFGQIFHFGSHDSEQHSSGIDFV